MRLVRRQVCVGCGVSKVHNVRNFYRSKTGKHGLRIKCIECVKHDVYENRELKSEYYREYNRKRNRDPKRRAFTAAWLKTPAGKESLRRSDRIYKAFKALESRL